MGPVQGDWIYLKFDLVDNQSFQELKHLSKCLLFSRLCARNQRFGSDDDDVLSSENLANFYSTKACD